MLPIAVKYKISSYGATDIGLVRQNNEDVWAQLPKLKFFILADGMGGHQAGEVAANETVKSLCKIFKKRLSQPDSAEMPLEEMVLLLKKAIMFVNAHVYKMGRSEPELHGMGTTLCCLLFQDEHLIYAHVGDSRIYRFRDRRLEQLTKDHSLISERGEQGQTIDERMARCSLKNIITKAIGTDSRVDPSVSSTPLMMGDLFLMCSDGLTDVVSGEEIEKVLSEAKDVHAAAEYLIAVANMRGGRDNVTVVLTRVEGVDEATYLSR